MAYRLLDLFCGEGGAALGYAQAGFEVTGVDKYLQPRYPFTFIHADITTLEIDLSEFDAIHASPPCQAHSTMKALWIYEHPDLIPETLALLEGFAGPWVVENVPGSELADSVTCCGAALGCHVNEPAKLVLKRHRLFASNIKLNVPPCMCRHYRQTGYMVLPIHGGIKNNPRMNSYQWDSVKVRRRLMGLPHASSQGLSQAIPAAFTHHLGKQLMSYLKEQAA